MNGQQDSDKEAAPVSGKESAPLPEKEAGRPPSYGDDDDVARPGIMSRMVDSFKRNPDYHVTEKGQVTADGGVFDVETAAQNTANSPLTRKLKGRHLQMIAIGGSIGMDAMPTLSLIRH